MAFEKGHALVIGVGLYANAPRANVPIAASDAQAVAAVLVDPRACGYPTAQVKLLLNEEATKAGTLAALDALAAAAGEDDTVFLYYCGHGAPGEDGNYYFVSHDASIHGGRVVAGTGMSEAELLDKLRAVKAKRVLVTLNTCYSGNVSPDSFSTEAVEIEAATPPADTSSAILATGKGRIIITAASESQLSYIGKGKQSIFTQALTDGLQGRGVGNRGGFISAFNLYEHIFDTVTEAVEDLMHVKQEPELTVIKGVGPFAVALFRGASSFGAFDENAPAPELDTVRQVKPEKAERLMNNIRINSPETTITNSSGVVSNVQGNVTQINSGGGAVSQDHIETGGGAFISGGVNTGGGSFTGRDHIVQGSEVHGNNNTLVGDITGSSGIAIGAGAQSTVTQTQGISAAELAMLFAPLFGEVRSAAPEKQPEAAQTIQAIQQEAARGKSADDTRLSRLLGKLVDLIPGAVGTVVSTFASPLLGGLAGPATQAILDRIRKE